VSPIITPGLDTGYVDSTPDVLDESVGTIARQFDSLIEKSEVKHKSETMKLVEEARRRVSPQDIENTQITAPTHQNSQPTSSQTNNTQDFWFMHNNPQASQPGMATFQSSAVVTPGSAQSPAQSTSTSDLTSADDTPLSEEELLESIHKKQEQYAMQTRTKHEMRINPDGSVEPQVDNKQIVEAQPQKIKEIKNVSTTPMTPKDNPDILKLAQSNDLNIETLSRQANKKTDFGDDEVVISLH
jgi:hypothetical protein